MGGGGGLLDHASAMLSRIFLSSNEVILDHHAPLAQLPYPLLYLVQGVNALHTYELEAITESDNAFRVDALSGAVVIARPLDFEIRYIYDLQVSFHVRLKNAQLLLHLPSKHDQFSLKVSQEQPVEHKRQETTHCFVL